MGFLSKKVLITGVLGFTGKYLEKLLISNGFQVFGIDFVKTEKPNYFNCDLTNREEVEHVLNVIKPDYIIHLAAVSFVATKDKFLFYKINVFGVLNILDSLTKISHCPQKIIIASSANVYGNCNVEVLDESICPNPVNHYSNSKLVMENMVKNYFNSFDIILTRPLNYTGPGQTNNFLIPKIVMHYKEKKERISLGNLDVIRDFSDIRFVVNAYLKLLESNVKSEIVNICSGVGTHLKNVIDILDDISGYKMEIITNPEFVRKNEIKKLVGSNKKLFSMIGFQRIYKIEEILLNMYRAE